MQIILQRRLGLEDSLDAALPAQKSRSIAGWSLGKPFGARVSGTPVKDSIVRRSLRSARTGALPHDARPDISVSPAAGLAPAYTHQRQSAPSLGEISVEKPPPEVFFPNLHVTTTRRRGPCTVACQKKIVCRDRCASCTFGADARCAGSEALHGAVHGFDQGQHRQLQLTSRTPACGPRTTPAGYFAAGCAKI